MRADKADEISSHARRVGFCRFCRIFRKGFRRFPLRPVVGSVASSHLLFSGAIRSEGAVFDESTPDKTDKTSPDSRSKAVLSGFVGFVAGVSSISQPRAKGTW